MALSMTGFGRGELIFDSRKYSVEIKSVNSRYIDINLRIPRLFNYADSDVRKKITDCLVRGKVDVFVNFSDTKGDDTDIRVNMGLVDSYSEAAALVAKETGREDDLCVARLLSYPDVVTVTQKSADEDKLKAELLETLDLALQGMTEMRKAEGASLASDLLSKVDALEALRNEVHARNPQVIEDYKQRLSDRIDEILTGDKRAFYDDQRLAAEVAVFADKCAIDEEMKRLTSHFAQARKILNSEGPVGKRMDFLIQEINREVNTTGSKANDIEITNNVLKMKNIVEEMREQVQNLV